MVDTLNIDLTNSHLDNTNIPSNSEESNLLSQILSNDSLNSSEIQPILNQLLTTYLLNNNLIHANTQHIFQWSQPTINIDPNSGETINIEYQLIYQVDEPIKKLKQNIRKQTKHLKPYQKIKLNDPILNNNEECSVCFEKYKINEYKRTLENCNHTFHKKCVDKWLTTNDNFSCPCCRTNYKPK